MATNPPLKRVELTTIQQSSGKPITSFLDYAPRTVDPPRIDQNGVFDADAYASYLRAYDIYLVKFFQVRRQFLTLHRDGPPEDPLTLERVAVGRTPGRLLPSGDTRPVPLLLACPKVALAPIVRRAPSPEVKKEKKKAARLRRKARLAAAKPAKDLDKAQLAVDLVKTKTALAKAEQGWTKVLSRKEKLALRAGSKVPASAGGPSASKGAMPLHRSAAVRRKPSGPSGSGGVLQKPTG